MHHQSKLIAIVGGSGAGKSWLARHLQRAIGPTAVRLSLDDFYHDRSQLLPSMRLKVNYDHPRAIDWEQLEIKLKACREGKCVQVPSYDFATHTRRMAVRSLSPGRVVLVDGLWLLLRRGVRPLFDFTIYLDCPTALRLERRIARDVTERGRQADTARRQFWESVVPMHDRYVAPQRCMADITIEDPPTQLEVQDLAETIRALLAENQVSKRRFSASCPRRHTRPVAKTPAVWVNDTIARRGTSVFVHKG
jgi:uridine kinase